MSITDIQDASAIHKAINECDSLGRDEFLSRYGFRRATRYFLEHNGKLYDSKAILGVAHGHEFPKQGALKSSQFSGGKSIVQKKLESLGFKIVVKSK